MKFIDLVRSTPPGIKKNAKSVSVQKKSMWSKGGNTNFIYVARDKEGSKRIHQCHVKLTFDEDEGEALSANDIAQVWCNCEHFTYNLEVALAWRNTSVIKKSNGKDPVIKNPNKEPALCKHLYKVSYELWNKYRGRKS